MPRHTRDSIGLEVLLTGQPATYCILSCTSLGTQNNVFAMLYLLSAGQPCLLHVDNYLKDFSNSSCK